MWALRPKHRLDLGGGWFVQVEKSRTDEYLKLAPSFGELGVPRNCPRVADPRAGNGNSFGSCLGGFPLCKLQVFRGGSLVVVAK